MNDIELYNRYLKKRVFEIENPFGRGLPGLPAKVMFRIIGKKDYLSQGESKEYLTYEVTIKPSGRVNNVFNNLMNKKKVMVITTTTTDFMQFRWACNEKLRDFLSVLGVDTPVICVSLRNEFDGGIQESIKEVLTEDVYDTITNKIVHDIIQFLKHQREGDFELPSDINGAEFYHFDGLLNDFNIELFLRQSDKVDTFDVDGDYYRDDDLIQIMIVTNPNSKNTILQDLVYELNELVRHELEHVKQHESGYEFPRSPKSSHKYYGQSHELDALRSGFKKRAKKEKKDLETVVRDWFEKNKHKYIMKPKQTEYIINRILQNN